MKIIVANLGSTSFKYKLFDMSEDGSYAPIELAKGSIDRIGSPEDSRVYARIGEHELEAFLRIPNHGIAVEQCLAQLMDREFGCLKSVDEVSGIGFKAVHGGDLSGVQTVTEEVLAQMQSVADIAPAHNPPYIAAMRQLKEKFPAIPLVAAFETGFHANIPEANRTYAVPNEWAQEWHIRKFGFHGASHRFISWRTPELTGIENPRIISCHLGGSSSVCAIQNGWSVGSSMGASPQGGLPQNNRVGDFDCFLLPVLCKRLGKSLEEVLTILGKQGGLLGISGVSTDIRDILAAADSGNHRAQLALDVLVQDIRRYMGGYLVQMAGTDALVFTGGIGEYQPAIRSGVCRNLECFGMKLDQEKNEAAKGVEARISTDDSAVQIWVIPTNEELVVATQTLNQLRG